MQAAAGNNIDAGGSVRASQKRNIGGMEFADDVQFVGDELFADGKRVSIEGLKDPLLRSGPVLGNPSVSSIGEIGVFGIVDGVDEPLAPLPIECRTLPDLILCEELNDAGVKPGIVAGKKHA